MKKISEQIDKIIEKMLHASDLPAENLAEILRMQQYKRDGDV